MKTITADDISNIALPIKGSHKGQNGRMLLIGGSELFHAASLWALTVASRVVDLVHYCSTQENNAIVTQAKTEFRNGIVVSRSDVESYIKEDDCILIGPGMTRDDDTQSLTQQLVGKYPDKQWVIDAGSLQMIRPESIPKRAILTPHAGEFRALCERSGEPRLLDPHLSDAEKVSICSGLYSCTVILKGDVDYVSTCGSPASIVNGGNPGMTKGGTGDVLSGLVAALACKNEPNASAVAASFINKAAGDSLFARVGTFFNASDLADEIPVVMKRLYYP